MTFSTVVVVCPCRKKEFQTVDIDKLMQFILPLNYQQLFRELFEP